MSEATQPLSGRDAYDQDTKKYIYDWATYYLTRTETPLYLDHPEVAHACLVTAMLIREGLLELWQERNPSRVEKVEKVIAHIATFDFEAELPDMEVIYSLALKVVTNISTLHDRHWKLFEQLQPGRNLHF